MSTSFGYLNKFGYGGHVFPVVIGESGSQYTEVRLLLLFSLACACIEACAACANHEGIIGWRQTIQQTRQGALEAALLAVGQRCRLE